MQASAAHLDVDPFDDAFLTNPYPFHEQIREAGAVVFLDRYGVYASARHAEVTAGLTNWETFSSAAGVGLADFSKEPPWRPTSIIAEADPPSHPRIRSVLARVLSPAAIQRVRPHFEAGAERFVEAAVARGAERTGRDPASIEIVGMLLCEAALATAAGGLIGCVLGVLLLRVFEHSLVYYLDSVGVPFVWLDTMSILLIALAVTPVAAILRWPALTDVRRMIGVTALVYTVIEAPQWGWGGGRAVAGFGIAAVVLTAFALW